MRNLAVICTSTDYNTRPLDTIYSNLIDALPVVRSLTPHQPIPAVILDVAECLSVTSSCPAGQVLLGKQQASDPLLHVRVYGKTIGSFLPKDHPLRKVMTSSGRNIFYSWRVSLGE
jgi:UDP-apiose/xylose synthase